MSIKLAYQVFGHGPPLVILHGLFGCKDNWRGLARQLARNFQVFTIDLRNHGKSPHSENFSYEAMADDLLSFLDSQGLGRVNLLGHSMGGKAAIRFAAGFPERLLRLIVVDVGLGGDPSRHQKLFAILEGLPISKLNSRTEVDRLLQPDVPNQAVRRFLLKNLERLNEGGFRWRFNLPTLKRYYPQLMAFLDIAEPIAVPTLFMRGEKSNYLPPELPPDITIHFKNVRMTAIKGAGHWVHVDQPAVFLREVTLFLSDGKIDFAFSTDV